MGEDPAGSVVVRSEFATTDPDAAEQFLRQGYMDNKLDITGSRDGFTFTHSTAAAPTFSINRLRIGVDLTFDAETTPDDALVVVEPMSGGLGYVDNRYSDSHVGAGGMLLCPPLGPTQIVTERFDVQVIPLDRAAVAEYAAAVTGLDPADLVFTAITPGSSAPASLWVDTVTHVRDDVLVDPCRTRGG